MRLSVAWIFDHIDADWRSIDLVSLVQRFNATTAEIEGFEKIALDKNQFSLVCVTHVSEAGITAHSTEWKKEFSLVWRLDAQEGDLFIVYQNKDHEIRWARSIDIGGTKNDLLPAIYCDEEKISGAWKKTVEWDDYILELDNKTITNRPDMWGHRGFAREIAAILQLPLKDLSTFIVPTEVKDFNQTAAAKGRMLITIDNKAPQECRRFAGVYIDHVVHHPSLIWMAFRLTRTESRAIDLLVDVTNYVMCDLSQPMHVFDVDTFEDMRIVPRMAYDGETLALLDGQTVTLTKHDLVITDGLNPLALAGVMGSKRSAENKTTKRIFVESANFNPITIRQSALRHKLRTESSARFEKNLDPNQNISGLKRFLRLLADAQIPVEGVSEIFSVGSLASERSIDVSHQFLESRIGTRIESTFVVKTLKALGFQVLVTGAGEDLAYIITVPSFRAAHLTIPEDIVEEVARFFGYTNIPGQLPAHSTYMSDVEPVYRLRVIKRYVAHALHMTEVQHYALFDQDFLRRIAWHPEQEISLKNPVSENWRLLLTTLMPHLFKAIAENAVTYHQLSFFEWGRIWQEYQQRPENTSGYVVGDGPFILEKKSLAGIFFDAKQRIDFYEAKMKLDSFFHALKLSVTWTQVAAESQAPWFDEYQTAHLIYEGTVIGTAGCVSPAFFANVAQGNAFIFELDGNFLLNYRAPRIQFKTPSKYPHVWLDMSVLVPLTVTVDQVVSCIESIDSRIVSVQLIDFFAKDEWKDKKSLTFRFVVQDPTKTLTKDEIDELWRLAVAAVEPLGAQVR